MIKKGFLYFCFLGLLVGGWIACGNDDDDMASPSLDYADDDDTVGDDYAPSPPPYYGDDDDDSGPLAGLGDDDDYTPPPPPPPTTGGEDGSSDDDDWTPPVGDDDDDWTPPPPPPDVDPPPTSTLSAGVLDDHENWDDFLNYLNRYHSNGVYQLDFTPRLRIQVVDLDDRPVPNARIDLGENGQIYKTMTTYSNGQANFFPDAETDTRPVSRGWIRASKDGAVAETDVNFSDGFLRLVLDGNPGLGAAVNLDLLFILDTTGSMSDEIEQLTATMESIAWRVDQLASEYQVQLSNRYGLVRYRDQGDRYVTQKADFTTNLNSFMSELQSTSANGGGDYPEDLNTALKVAMREMSWTSGEAVRLAILIADAPPHLDYGQNYSYLSEAIKAQEMGIRIYPIASSGTDDDAQYTFRQMAVLTGADYIFVRGNRDGSGPGSGSEYVVGRLDDIITNIISDELEPLQAY